MKTGLDTRGILYYLFTFFVVAGCFSQTLEVTHLNNNQIIPEPYHSQPYIDDYLMQHEILGVEFKSHYINNSTDQYYIAYLELDKYTAIPLPSYVEGWEDQVDTLAPGEEIVFRSVVFIRPTVFSPVGLDSFIVRSWMRLGLSPLERVRSHIAKIRINVVPLSCDIPILEDEPLYTRGTANTVYWTPVEGDILQDAYCFDVEDRENLIHSVMRLYRASQTDIRQADFEDLKDGHRYGYFIKSVQNTPGGEKYVYSDICYSTQDNTPPLSILHLQALYRLNKTVQLSWGAVTDALSGVSSYRIYRGVDTHSEALVAELPHTGANFYTWIDTEPISGNTNYYRVCAVDLVGNEGDGERSNGIDVDGDDDYTPPGGDAEDDTTSTSDISYHRGAVDTLWIELDGREEEVRFEVVRDSLGFFESPPVVGSRYYDSGWLTPDALQYNPDYCDSVYYVFDYSKQNGIDIDQNFVDGHTYYRRVTKKYHSITDVIQLEEVIPDCFPPRDTYNVKAVAVMDDPDLQDPLSGYKQWHLEVSWQPVEDNLSGLKRYHLYRKIEEKDTHFVEMNLSEDFKETFFKDTLCASDFAQLNNPLIAYRIVAEDRVGNLRSVDDTDWEVQERALGAPGLMFGDTSSAIIYPPNPTEEDTVFINQDYVTFRIENFDISEVMDYVVFVNGLEETDFSFDQDVLIVPLPDAEVSEIQVRALYEGKRSSTWSSKKILVQTQDRPPMNLIAWNDTTYWEGHHYLQWHKPSLDAVGYEVWRWNEAGDSKLIGIVNTREDIIQWIDYYDLSELSGESGDVLTNYELYEYRVLKINMFNEKTGFSNTSSTYCNHPPVIVDDEIKKSNDEEVILIQWKRIEPTLATGSWVTRIRVFRDRLDNMIYQTDDITSIVDDTVYTYDMDVELGHNYIFQIKEMPAYPAGRVSSWSKPYTVNLASLDSLFIQPQPGGHIFLSWEEDTLIDRLPVDRIELCRITNGDTSCIALPNTQTSYMDPSDNLVHGQVYHYRVSALNNLGQILATNTKEATCDTGRVYVPEVVPFYHGYFNSDSLEVFWRWSDIAGNPLEGTTRGAVSLRIQISVSQTFPLDTMLTTTTTWFDADACHRSRKIKIPGTVNTGNEMLFCRMTARDRWGHPEPMVYSKKKTVVFDPVFPKPVKNFTISSVTSYNGESNRIYVHLQWTGEGVEWPENETVYWSKLIGNVAEYHIVRVSSSNDTVDVGHIPVHTDINGEDMDFTYTFQDNVINSRHHWGIASIDSAGNEAVMAWVEPDSFLATPQPPNPVGFKSCVFQPVGNSGDFIEYSVEIAMNPNHFQWAYDSSLSEMVGHLLCQSGWITRTEFACTSGWGSIQTDTTWFRIKVRRNMNWESGWSNLAFYTEADGASPGKTTDADNIQNIPTVFKINQNVPNPFNAETSFTYQLPDPGQVTIQIYNVRGSLVRTLHDGHQFPGFYSMIWDGRDGWGRNSASGIYFIHIVVETQRGDIFQDNVKMMMIK
ncbi:hypothetical protein JW824_03845 [bacterium]|nr:hypothetical protein [bacterium]